MILTLKHYKDKVTFLSYFRETILNQIVEGINLKKGKTKGLTIDKIAKHPHDLRIQISKILIRKEVKKHDNNTASVQTASRRRKKA
jgi:hypothetical protein